MPTYLAVSKMLEENHLGNSLFPSGNLLVLIILAARRQQADFTETLKSTFKNYMATKPVKTIHIEPSGRRPGAKRVKLYYGPHTLPKKGEVLRYKATGG